MIHDATIQFLSAQPTMSIQVETAPAHIAAALAEMLGEVWQYVVENGGRPTAPPFSRARMAGAKLLLEAGLPVATALPDHGRVRSGAFPAGPVASANHYGAYTGLKNAEEELIQWAKSLGREPSGPVWMLYHTDPSTEPEESHWRTELFLPLKEVV
jgi:effector-binding domain-containing protein